MSPGAKYSEMSTIHVLHLQPVLLSKFSPFFPITDGALFVATLTAPDQSTPTLFSTPRRELKISSAVVICIMGTNPRNSSVTDKVSSTPRINMASCAMSAMSVLSSSATENITNDLTLFFSWLSKFADMSEILPATMFLVRLILAKTSASQNTRFLQPLGCSSPRTHPHSMALMLTVCH